MRLLFESFIRCFFTVAGLRSSIVIALYLIGYLVLVNMLSQLIRVTLDLFTVDTLAVVPALLAAIVPFIYLAYRSLK